MTSPTAEARTELADLLEPVWPGRVRPYLPSTPRPNAGIYIDEPTSGWFDEFNWSGTFPVVLVADGADHAARAMLDDLADQAYWAVANSSRFYPESVTPSPLPVGDGSTELPARTFQVRTELDMATWCASQPPEAVTLPPQPVGV